MVICVLACSKGRDYHLVNTCKQSNTPYSATLTYPLANPPIPPPLQPSCNLIHRYALHVFEKFPVQTIPLNPLIELLKTKSGFKTNRILPLYSKELQVKIKHKCKCTNNQQMSQLRYHCMPPGPPIRCTYTCS